MVNIDQIEEMGGSIPSGVLFFGPAGTGKTAAAMALAKASKWAFIKTNGHDLLHEPKKLMRSCFLPKIFALALYLSMKQMMF